MIQDPSSKDVRSKTNWGLVGLKPKSDAQSIMMLRPKTRPKSKSMRDSDLGVFMKQKGYASTGQMKPADWVKLKQIQNLGIPIGGFAAYQAYDKRFTESINPDEEIPTAPDLQWSSNEPSEQAEYVRDAMMIAARKLKIDVSFAGEDHLKGAKGYSAGGKIVLLQGHDGIGGLSTMAHELSHEILHQNFLQNNPKIKIKQ